MATPALIRDFSPQVGRGAAMGVLDAGPGARQPRGHRGLQPHAVQPPRLAVPVPPLRDRRARGLGDRARRPARALPAAARPADGQHARPGADRGPRRRARPGAGAQGPLAADARSTSSARRSRSASSCCSTTSRSRFFVVYFATVFGYTREPQRTTLANWYWIANAIALVVAASLSDRLLGPQAVHDRRRRHQPGRHRRCSPLAATNPHTSYYTFALYFVLHGRRRRRRLRAPGWRASPRRSRSTTRPPRRPAWRSGAGSSALVVTVSSRR